MPPPFVNTLNCLILQSKTSLKDIPPRIIHYFVNSKRRFFVYFKSYQQMVETMQILSANNVRFYPRQSLLPDRQELQQLVYHCNFKYKKQDLRKNLHRDTPYNQPKLLFDQYKDGKRIVQEPQSQEYSGEQKQMQVQLDQKDQNLNTKQYKKQRQKEQTDISQEIKSILENKFLLKQIFEALNQAH